MTHVPTAGDLARYDQAHAASSQLLDALIETHAEAITEDGQRELRTAALAHFLRHHVTRTTCAELLATAIDRTVHQGGPSRV